MIDTVAVKPKKLEFISLLRAASMFSILLCHYVQWVPIPIVKLSAQLFNVGVPLFFIISGFCFGLQGEISSALKWYGKRLKRVYLPYETFLLMYFALFLILGKRIFWKDWIMNAFGIQGNYFRIPGIEQTWFITALLACYLVTPLVSMAAGKLQNCKTYIKLILVASAAVFYLLVCFNPSDNLYVIASPIVFYIAAYLKGRHYNENTPNGLKSAILSALLAFAAFGIRFMLVEPLDGTMLYNRLVSSITHYIAAFGIFNVFEYVFRNLHEIKIVKLIDSISFEVYLCHYSFLCGAIWFTRLTENIYVNLIISAAATFATSIVIHLITVFIRYAVSLIKDKKNKIFPERI